MRFGVVSLMAIVATVALWVAPAMVSAQTCPDGTFPVNGACPVHGSLGAQPPGGARVSGGGTHMDDGLIIAGSVTLGAGYLTSLAFGIVGNNFILFIPVVGGAIHAPVNGTLGGILLGVGVSAVQVVGLSLLIAGLAAHHPDEPLRAGLEPELVPGPGEAGLGLRWRF